VTANSVCPGFVVTNLVDMGPLRPLMKAAARTPFVNTPAQGARLVVRLADPALDGVTGRLYTTTPGMRLLPPVPAMLDSGLQRRIWQRTERLVGLTPAA
jgi:retinol dehydrogenase 12